jgi:hypothetical protein
MSASNDRPMDAVQALRDRGIDNPESLLQYADPEAIIRTCEWWDGLKNVGTGLLVSKVREGGIASPDGLSEKARKHARLVDRFAEVAQRFAPGDVTETHARMQCRACGTPDARWQHPDEEELCGGDLVVIAVSSDIEVPCIEVRCDACLFESCYSPRSAAVLPEAPVGRGRDEPAVPCPARMRAELELRRHEDRSDDIRRLDLAKAKQSRPRLVEAA